MRAVIEQFEGRAEAIYVDDGCSDRTVQILTSQAALDHRINVLRLSRNFGHQVAVAAGMELANGQAVVVIDADLQDPPEVNIELIAAWRGELKSSMRFAPRDKVSPGSRKQALGPSIG
jgi:glycosyltransferase involved in cell wall biosynthesis